MGCSTVPIFSNHGQNMPHCCAIHFWGDSDLPHLFVFFLHWTEYGKDDGEEDEAVEEAKETDHEEDLKEKIIETNIKMNKKKP